jgi:hypothetical protein
MARPSAGDTALSLLDLTGLDEAGFSFVAGRCVNALSHVALAETDETQ